MWMSQNVRKHNEGGDTLMPGYGARLKELRGAKSQESVANDVGISVSALGMYETEQRVPRDEIKIRLANYYNSTVQDIFFA